MKGGGAATRTEEKGRSGSGIGVAALEAWKQSGAEVVGRKKINLMPSDGLD